MWQNHWIHVMILITKLCNIFYPSQNETKPINQLKLNTAIFVFAWFIINSEISMQFIFMYTRFGFCWKFSGGYNYNNNQLGSYGFNNPSGIVYGTGSGYTYNQASNSYGYPSNYNTGYYPSTTTGGYYNSPYRYNNYQNAYNGYNGYNQGAYTNGGYGYTNGYYPNNYYQNSQRVIGLPYNQGYTQQYNNDGYVYWLWEKNIVKSFPNNTQTHADTDTAAPRNRSSEKIIILLLPTYKSMYKRLYPPFREQKIMQGKRQ